MSREATARRIYEARVIDDGLARLGKRIDLSKQPCTQDELNTLAKRARAAFRGGDSKVARFRTYQDHLSSLYGSEIVTRLCTELVAVNNEIGYEEK